MNYRTKSIYLNPEGPLEAALLLPETAVLLLNLIFRRYDLKRYAENSFAFRESERRAGMLQGSCRSCGGKESLGLEVRSGLACCSVCGVETDAVRLTRERSCRCRYLVYALDHLLNVLLAGDLEEKRRLVERLENLTKAIEDTVLTTEAYGEKRILARLQDAREWGGL